MKGKKFSEVHKLNLSLSKHNRKRLSVINLQTSEETIFNSISQAEKSARFT